MNRGDLTLARFAACSVLAAVAFVVTASVASAETVPGSVQAVAPTSLDGPTLFRARCGVCHLAGGTGTFMLGRRLGASNALLAERTNLDPAYVRQVVRNGIVSMPRITRAEVSDAELQAILTYLTRNSKKE